ncbi:hypothetical protein [Gimesia sp.]|uniref:hypothetical protein n=1 Tax=Gimesia sp. TaxID=2024833 RepID=UPI0025C0B2CA|nr:hypothetical protein [Gimesia sp.]|tara:strand:+ start:344 stop:511 length:168 start_codon:yes stop_codon:yes gene_type:complete
MDRRPGNEILMVLLSCLITYSLILVYTRITTLRSFSNMSAADFVMTLIRNWNLNF